MIVLIFIGFKQTAPEKSTAYSIKFIHIAQDFKTDSGQLIEFADSMQIYFDGAYCIYKRPSLHVYAVNIFDKHGNFIGEKVTHQDTTYTYTIYKEKNKYGYLFDSITASKPHKLNVDTFLRTTVNKGFNFLPGNSYRLTETKWSADKDTLFEQYFCADKKDVSYADSIYYYYDKRLTDVNFSLSIKLDSLKKSKLVRVRFIYNKIPKGKIYNGKTFDFDTPRRELSYEIRKNIGGESPTLVNFINLFKSKEKELYNGN